MDVAGLEVVEGGEIDAVFSIMRAGAIGAAYEVLGAGGTMPEGPAGELSMAPLSSTRQRASSGRLLTASRMYLICSASDGIDGLGRDPAMKGSLVELVSSYSSSRSHGRSLGLCNCVKGPVAPFYPGGSVIEFVS
ncbi:hypothetical protein B9Z19DRAFT_1102922 [Tuber borchii]|uniref:Uncharacterized protein n=1 Tax=Tuber borchii TaxID=42251 RepID=A0A2T6ZJ26_TUBBO|nr:hypothetical protein B9Z19DRAFT_1102922 [Tuber borchii]